MHSIRTFHSSFRRNRTLLQSGVIAIILVIAISVLVAILHLRQVSVNKAAITTQNLVTTLELTVEGLIGKVDISLQSSADEIARQFATGKLSVTSVNPYLMRQQSRLPGIAFVRATNERGDVVYGVGAGQPSANIADRDYFIRLRNDRDAGLVVGKAIMGRISRQWIWPFARRITKPDGTFGGIVFASIPLIQIEDLFSHVALGEGGSIAMRDPDMRLIARFPPASTIKVPMGSQRLSTPYVEALKTYPLAGTYNSGATSIDHISRTHSYRRSAKYGFTLNVGIADRWALAEWRKQIWILTILVALFILALLLFLRLIKRAWLRQEEDLAALEASRQANAEGEQQLEAILNNIPESVILINADGTIARANPATFELHGLASSAPLSTIDEFFQLLECSYPDGRVLETDAWPAVRALKGEFVKGIEMCVRRRDTGKNWVALHWALPIYHRGQVQAQALLGIQDITERKRAEQALQRSEQKFAAAFRASPDSITITSCDEGRIIDASDSAVRMSGYSREELLGHSTTELNFWVDEKSRISYVNKLKEHGRVAGMEAAFRFKSGEIRIGQVYGELIEIDGKPHILGIIRDVTEMKQTEKLIWEQANFDSLTKLPNRRMFGEHLHQCLAQAKGSDTALALLLIDLDQFKEVNDTLGHDRGDILLKEVAHRIAACLPAAVTLARLGGDEFTVILTETSDLDHVNSIAKKIIATLAAPFQLGLEKVFISASIGIAQFPDAGSETEHLLRHADQAMYAAKNAGRNRYAHFSRGLQDVAQSRLRLTNDLRRALAENQLEVYYQPIVEMATGRIEKAEALLRWDHPTRGMVSPVEFIPLAEASGLILEIGEWVFKQAVEQVRRLHALNHAPFKISVNVSPMQFRNDDGLNTRWLTHLATAGLSAQSMVIEITEGLLLDLTAEVKDKLLAFGDAGIQVALDDFGTGYSSLAYLKKFDIDYLKIDRAFVKNIETDSEERALCEAIIVMAHKLGLRVIAEGVETAVQRDFLHGAGCDFAQGYLFSKPVPAKQFEALLALAAETRKMDGVTVAAK